MLKQTPKIKVILMRNYKGLGKVFDIVPVRAGYARNYLAPQGIALIAGVTRHDTSNVLKPFKDNFLKKYAEEEAKDTEACQFINNKQITITAKADSNGRLYRKIRAHDVVMAVSQQLDRKIYSHWLEKFAIATISEDQSPVAVKGEFIRRDDSIPFVLLVAVVKEKKK